MKVVEMVNVCKTYHPGMQDLTVLNNINFSLDNNELVAITGASGSGKSTIMNILGCLDAPSKGKYILDNEDVSKLSSNKRAYIRNRKIGFIFQSFNLLNKLNAIENVEVPMLYGDFADTRKKSIKALEDVGLGDRLTYRPNQLSGGECQRIAIARALVTEPSIILADEPTGNLDSKTTEEIMELLLKLHSKGATLIIVTHEPDIAARCKRIIRLQDGKIIEDKRLND